MKTTITESDFLEAFKRCGRGENFSHSGLVALFGYLTDLEADMGEELELDPIAICCDFAEYPTIAEAAADYGMTPKELAENTEVIEFTGGVIIRQF